MCKHMIRRSRFNGTNANIAGFIWHLFEMIVNLHKISNSVQISIAAIL